MDNEVIDEIRQAGNLQLTLNRYRVLLENQAPNSTAIYNNACEDLSDEFDGDLVRIVDFIKLKLLWPLAFKRSLLNCVKQNLDDQETKMNNFANFVLNPTENFKREISKPRRRFGLFLPSIATIERQYGTGVSALFHLQYGFLLMNLFTLILWVAAVTIPYKAFSTSSSSSPFSDDSFEFSTIFTTKGYLAASVLFQGSYRTELVETRYNLPLFYLLTAYFYFILWFIFLTVRFAKTYKQKVLKSILNENSGTGFLCTFSRYDFTIVTQRSQQKHQTMLRRQFLDFMGDDERTKSINAKKFKTRKYQMKIIITNLFYIVLAVALGALNWLILSFCNRPNVDCSGSIIYLCLINRLMPYAITMMTQIETYKYVSYKLDAVGLRCAALNISTVLSFTIYFFVNSPSCYETAFGQFIYILLLADLFASLIFPLFFGLLFDLILGKKYQDFDAINVHVQLSPPVLLYSQFLIWLGIYFAPLLSILVVINLLFSFLSHRLYLFIRSRRTDASNRVFIWNSQRLEYMFHLFAYILLIVSVTCFVVFTTQLRPSTSCGPFRSLNASYEVISSQLEGREMSVVLVSVVNFGTSPGLIYFLGVIFFVISYKLRQEGLAEKQLVFIRQNNLDSKKNLRKRAVTRLHQQGKQKPIGATSAKTSQPAVDTDDEDSTNDDIF